LYFFPSVYDPDNEQKTLVVGAEIPGFIDF